MPLLSSGWVTLGTLLQFSEPQFLCSQHKGNLAEFLGVLKVILGKPLTHNRPSVKGHYQYFSPLSCLLWFIYCVRCLLWLSPWWPSSPCISQRIGLDFWELKKNTGKKKARKIPNQTKTKQNNEKQESKVTAESPNQQTQNRCILCSRSEGTGSITLKENTDEMVPPGGTLLVLQAPTL